MAGVNESVLGLILAGGQSRRMGGRSKALLPLAGTPMLQHVINRLRPQTHDLLLNVNDSMETYAPFGLPMVADSVGGFCGPLAGILGGVEWAERNGYRFVASVAVDCPLIPTDLVRRLYLARNDNQPITIAVSGGQRHHVIGLWSTELAPALRLALTQDNIRAVKHFLNAYAVAESHWPLTGHDPFQNINTPEDLAAIEATIRQGA